MTAEEQQSGDDPLWPVPGMKIFTKKGDHRFLAFLQWQHDTSHREYNYISGFREAAELIFERIEATGYNQDSLTFPLGLCWRHHMELQLKSLLVDLQRYQRQPVNVPKTHSLLQLWNLVRPLLEAVRPEDPVEETDAAQSLLMQLHQVDSAGEDFRYAKHNDGKPTLAKLETVDLSVFHRAMQALSNFFEGTGTAIYEDDRLRQEFEDWQIDQADW
jgi:hypothetical protein